MISRAFLIAAGGLMVAAASPAAYAQNAAVTVSVDVTANRRPISPLIYGLNYGEASLTDLNSPIHRSGGNNMSRYNWQINADNRGNDWYYQSIAEASAAPSGRINSFVSTNKAAGAESMVTIPTIGWVAKLGPNRSKTWSFSIAKYGAQQGADWQWVPDAGNGVRTNGSFVTGNDPNDASIPAGIDFMRPWVQNLLSTFGAAGNGGVRYYLLDNEPGIWHSTHRDVHPVGATMDEVFTKMRDTAAMVKGVDPAAQLVGPEEWGWTGYIYSGYDAQYGSKNGWGYLPDRAAHGNQDFIPWLLQQFKADQATRGKRLLDVLSVHIYPQGGEFSDDVSTAMQLRRNRSTRALWDPNYVDETWIGTQVKLIPRLKGWVDTYYPATRTGITEYNWGAEGHINGATTQADILGIFGREGLDIATRWTTPSPSSPTYKAMKMYRNYDGNKSSFGDTSVKAVVPNPDTLSAFASQDSANDTVKVMVISKALSGTTPVTINIANFAPGSAAQVWQLTSANTISRKTDVAVDGTARTVSLTVPAQSITLLVVPKSSGAGSPTGGSGLKGSYFNNARLTGTPTLVRVDPSVDFNWGSASPAAGVIGADNFSARWEGQLEAPVSGTYTFYTVSDAGVRLYVDSKTLVDNWTNHAATENTGRLTLTLQAGQKVPVKMEFWERSGDAVARLLWSYPGQAKQAIPQNRLYPAQ